MAIALLLTVVGILTRLLSVQYELWNLVPMGALALFAGARLKSPWSFLAPLAAWVASDLVIDTFIFPGFGRGPLDPVRLSIYGWLIAMVGIGMLPRKDAHPFTRASLALVAACTFFVVTNFAEWAAGSIGYPKTGQGLLTCYAAAVPFFHRTLIAELVGTGVLFGADALVRRVFETRTLAVPSGQGLD